MTTNSKVWPVILAACICQTFALCGCGDSRLMSIHMANDQKAEAKKRWDSMRGRVKLQLAEQNLEAGRLVEAQKSLDEAIGLCPRDPKAFVLSARLRLEQGKLAEAREAISLAISLAPSDAEASFLAGMIDQRYGELESALGHFTVAAAGAPQSPDYLLAQTETLLAMDRPVDAWELLGARIDDFENDASMRLLAARIHRILGLKEPAVQYAREAARIEGPGAPGASRAELGLLLVWAGRYHEAIEVLETLVNKEAKSGDPEVSSGGPNASVVHALARAYLETGRWAQAQQTLKRVMNNPDEDGLSWSMYARSAMQANPGAPGPVADEAIQNAMSHGRSTPDPLVLAALIAYSRRDFPAAERAADDALQMNPSLVAAHCLKGRAAEAQGRRDAARSAYAAALAVDPHSDMAGALIASLDTLEKKETSIPPALGRTELKNAASENCADGQ